MNYMILVDPQIDFFSGKLKNPEAERIMPNMCKAIAEHKGFIIATKDTHFERSTSVGGSTIEECIFPEHCIAVSYGWNFPEEILSALNKQGSYCGSISKGTFTALHLPEIIREMENMVNKLDKSRDICVEPSFVIIGLVTDICVISNALLLRSEFPKSAITVYADCCAGTTKERHQAALDVMKSCCIRVENRFDPIETLNSEQ